jgi:CBS domain-containing protein
MKGVKLQMEEFILVKQRMTTDFKTVSPNHSVADASKLLARESATFCVIVTQRGEPIRIATDEQLQGLPDPSAALSDVLNALPSAIVIEEEQDMDGVVKHLAPLLLAERDIRGVVVISGGDVSGVLPRKDISEHARLRIRTRGAAEIYGDPISHAPTYVCPLGDHEENVELYDPNDPPRCPAHGLILVRKN